MLTRALVRAAAAAAITLVAGCGADDGPAGPAPPSSALRFSQLDAGYYHTCGLTPSGAVWCWGRNFAGALGDGTTDDRTRPVAVADNHSFISIDVGAGHACGLATTGTAWCWGQNDEGQLADGTFGVRTRPVPVGGRAFVAVSAGHAHTCGLTAPGEVWCWGDDSFGQLGDGAGAAQKSAIPVRVQHDQPFAAVSAGYYQTCALTIGGAAWCWGQNGSGQNGDGTLDHRHAPVAVLSGLRFTTIAVGDRFVCATSSSQAWCWGANRVGELGAIAADPTPSPHRLENAPDMVAVTASAGTSTIPSAEPYGCGFGKDGFVSCWGGAVGSLRGRGPVAVLDDRIRASAIAAGAEHVCLLSRDGYAYCGGANYAGQLGDGTRTDRPQLIPVPGPGA